MSIRTEKYSRLILREVAEILRLEIDAPANALLTVTNVRVTKDLSIAYVYVSIFAAGGAGSQAAFEILKLQTSKIRGILGKKIRHSVRSIPEIRFFLDDSPEYAADMDKLFDQIHAGQDQKDTDHADKDHADKDDESQDKKGTGQKGTDPSNSNSEEVA